MNDLNEIFEHLKADIGPVLITATAFGVGTEALQHGAEFAKWYAGPVEIATALMVGICMMIGTRVGRRMSRA